MEDYKLKGSILAMGIGLEIALLFILLNIGMNKELPNFVLYCAWTGWTVFLFKLGYDLVDSITQS